MIFYVLIYLTIGIPVVALCALFNKYIDIDEVAIEFGFFVIGWPIIIIALLAEALVFLASYLIRQIKKLF
ncbi:MAG: hypothetical protein AB1489_33235 [Acidobacteriota bacterium]